MASMMTGRRRQGLWSSERGAELVEFALVFPTLLLVLAGLMDLGFLFQRYEVVTNAAREGARVASLPGYSDADVQSRVSSYMTAAGLTCSSCASVGAPQSITVGSHCIQVRPVTVTYDSQMLMLGPVFSLMGGGSAKTIHATSAMRMEIAAESCTP
jgi:Flp pilus assembly protein TadG